MLRRKPSAKDRLLARMPGTRRSTPSRMREAVKTMRDLL